MNLIFLLQPFPSPSLKEVKKKRDLVKLLKANDRLPEITVLVTAVCIFQFKVRGAALTWKYLSI